MKMKKYARIAVAISVALLTVITRAQLSFVDLKGSYRFFSTEKSHLLPIHGCAWWHTNILSNLYLHGNDADATVQLIKKLFYIIEDDLRPTKHPNAVATYFGPETIGAIIGAIEDELPANEQQKTITSAITHNLRYEQRKCSADELLKKIEEKISQADTTLKSALREQLYLDGDWLTCRQILTSKNADTYARQLCIFGLTEHLGHTPNWKQAPKVKELLAKATAPLVQEMRDQHAEYAIKKANMPGQIEALKKELKQQRNKKSDLTRMINRIAELATLITDAHAESSPHGEQQKYAPFTLHNILLSLLWASATTPNDLHRYALATGYSSIPPQEDFCCLDSAGITSEHAASFLHCEKPYLINDEESICRSLTKKIRGKQSTPISNKEFEQLIFAIMAESLKDVPIVDDTVATYEGTTFPDCVETTVRNLLNITL